MNVVATRCGAGLRVPSAHQRPAWAPGFLTAVAVYAALIALLAAGPAEASPAAESPASRILPEPVLAGPAVAGSPSFVASSGALATGSARAAVPGSGGWYWPIGTEDFRGWSGWLVPRGVYLHVAQDMPCSYGHPVYAIGDGIVFISRADAGGYGVGGAPGGCIIIVHTTAAGQKFHALYGHVDGLRVKEGERVTAGEVIARVNGCRHLHFSIHPGATYRDGNPYAGHVPRSWVDHGGFVDPVGFLKTNPRAAAYDPPDPPRDEIVTTSPPLQFGAADGAAYWTEEGTAGSVTYRYDLATHDLKALALGEAVPAYDMARYTVVALAAPALGLSVTDHMAALVLGAAHTTPVWGADAQLTAAIANAAGAPFGGAVIDLQWLDGSTWRDASLGVSDPRGQARLLYVPDHRVTLRATFVPPADEPVLLAYPAAQSRSVTIVPHVALTRPRLPATVTAGALLTVTGYLAPAHTVGANCVDLVFQRRGAGGDWVTRRTADAVDRDAGGRSLCVGHVRISAPGAWRVQAWHPADEAHAETRSAWSSFAVK